MPRLYVTKENVDAVELTNAGQVLYYDTKLMGFGLRVGTRTKAYFAEKRVDGRTVRTTIGRHGQFTPAEARARAQKALGTMADGVDVNAEQREKVAKRERAKEDARAQVDYTLGKLCDWYIQHQKKLGKLSWADAENVFKNHVKADPLAAAKARDVTAKEITVLVRRLVEAEKGRTGAKLRSYLRAAYALAMGAETNPQAPADLVLFGVESNPVAATAALTSFNKVRRVVATEALLGEVVRLMRERRAEAFDPGLAAAEFGLVLAGQRPKQVLRIKRDDLDLESATVTLLDPKGRRTVPRRHMLPLVRDAAALAKDILKHCRGEALFGDDAGPVGYTSVSQKTTALILQARTNLIERAKHSKRPSAVPPEIQVRDLRRTAETVLASMGIGKDMRAQLLSHGISGVQDRHYDQHEYMAEKRKALRAWEAKLQELATGQAAPSNVRTLNRSIREFTKSDPKLAFIDVFPPMLGEDGKPRPDIFNEDGLHMNARGYALWTRLIAPYLK